MSVMNTTIGMCLWFIKNRFSPANVTNSSYFWVE